ncbi:arylsulfatase [Teredinibacter sp. KSP-S5-2]|uniref:arylsulfatase n=1 Tax=Teredinibacter sp. KSP-S5-2 TaxID=3034506 RepID=UPI0029341C51|nr:arylsulfatase [Teredinibacter sp. KSP-S5-2]WNO11436.1 arylsulfatase [Teredinibacter sp. KSP-S5-2]
MTYVTTKRTKIKKILVGCVWVVGLMVNLTACAEPSDKPNVLLIMVDDVAPNSLSAYSHGMQYPTPNIDRIANEGALFTDHYSQPSCTAGRAAILMGQLPIRTGLTTVGQPGNPLGIRQEDPTLAEILKEEGYMTAQYGKNHLGDLDQHLPTLHGFDEFYGNLYHLNVSEEPEQEDYPKSAEFRKKFLPRGVIESYATADGGQKVKDTGPLTRERMKVFDEEILARSLGFMERAKKSNKPFFIWHASSRMHVYTHLKKESRHLATPISSEEDLFGSGLMEHDGHVGQLLDKLKQLGMDKNTIVIYTTDNGPEQSTWPHAGVTQFRGEKMTTWEGGVRAPFLVRWPAKIPAGLKLNGISAHEDVLPTVAAAVGRPNINEELKKSHKVYIDGFNNLDYWMGKKDKSARNHFFYYYESDLTAVRVGPWKMHFATKERYFDDMVFHTMPQLFNLRKDPYEHYDDITGFHQIMIKSWVFQPMIALLTDHVKSFSEFPPRQEGASLNINEAIQKAKSMANRQ